MMQKKGAVEFSMTTIIVVIIGVIILAIAIPWITGTLNKAGSLTDAAFDNALKQLQGNPTPDNPIILSQDSFTLKRGENAPLIVRFLSDGSSRGLSFTGGEASDWFESDGSLASVPLGQTYDWRVVVSVPDDAAVGNYFPRANIGTKSIPIVLTVE